VQTQLVIKEDLVDIISIIWLPNTRELLCHLAHNTVIKIPITTWERIVVHNTKISPPMIHKMMDTTLKLSAKKEAVIGIHSPTELFYFPQTSDLISQKAIQLHVLNVGEIADVVFLNHSTVAVASKSGDIIALKINGQQAQTISQIKSPVQGEISCLGICPRESQLIAATYQDRRKSQLIWMEWSQSSNSLRVVQTVDSKSGTESFQGSIISCCNLFYFGDGTLGAITQEEGGMNSVEVLKDVGGRMISKYVGLRYFESTKGAGKIINQGTFISASENGVISSVNIPSAQRIIQHSSVTRAHLTGNLVTQQSNVYQPTTSQAYQLQTPPPKQSYKTSNVSSSSKKPLPSLFKSKSPSLFRDNDEDLAFSSQRKLLSPSPLKPNIEKDQEKISRFAGTINEYDQKTKDYLLSTSRKKQVNLSDPYLDNNYRELPVYYNPVAEFVNWGALQPEAKPNAPSDYSEYMEYSRMSPGNSPVRGGDLSPPRNPVMAKSEFVSPNASNLNNSGISNQQGRSVNNSGMPNQQGRSVNNSGMPNQQGRSMNNSGINPQDSMMKPGGNNMGGQNSPGRSNLHQSNANSNSSRGRLPAKYLVLTQRANQAKVYPSGIPFGLICVNVSYEHHASFS